MKSVFAALLVAGAPVLALAQASTPATKAAPSAPAAKAASSSSSAAKPAAKPAPKPRLARSAQKAVEEVTPVEDDPSVKLTDADLELARKVHVGDMRCELGASVKVTAQKREGFFLVTTKGHRFNMHPVESRTGAIRLEDTRRGAMWLQLGNKSMLMSQKLGQRLADECQSPEQVTYAEYLKANPQPNLIDGSMPSRPAGEPAVPPVGTTK
jgi:hypothetical protein